MSCSYDDTLKMWLDDEDDWFCAETLSGHSSTVWDACFNSTGTHLASVSEDKSLIIWRYSEPATKPSSVDDLYASTHGLLSFSAPHGIGGQKNKLDESSNTNKCPHKSSVQCRLGQDESSGHWVRRRHNQDIQIRTYSIDMLLLKSSTNLNILSE